jgi:hypothetical protein
MSVVARSDAARDRAPRMQDQSQPGSRGEIRDALSRHTAASENQVKRQSFRGRRQVRRRLRRRGYSRSDSIYGVQATVLMRTWP